MAIDGKYIRTMVRMKEDRPVIDNLSVSLDDLYRDKDEYIYTERLSWLEIELSDQLDQIKKKKYEFEENRKKDITECKSSLEFIDSFFKYYNEGFNPDSQDTTAADTCFGLFAYIPELEQEIQKHEAANETSERNALRLVLNDLQRLNSTSESPPAKKIALKYQQEILQLKNTNSELLTKIHQLEKTIVTPLLACATVTKAEVLSSKQEAVLQLLGGNHQSRAPELSDCLELWYELVERRDDNKTVNGNLFEAEVFLRKKYPDVDINKRLVTRTAAIIGYKKSHKKLN